MTNFYTNFFGILRSKIKTICSSGMIPLLLQIKKMNLNQYHTGHTFEKDLTKKDEILTHLLIITENLSKRLRKEKLKTNSIGITIRLNNFTDLSKQKAIPYTDSTIDIYNVVKELYAILRKKSNLPIRYLMVKFNSLDKNSNTEQLNLFDIAEEKKQIENIPIHRKTKKENIDNAIDSINNILRKQHPKACLYSYT